MILGIDPGLSGALAWYSVTRRELVSVMPMPVLEPTEFQLTLNKSLKKKIDIPTLAKIVCASAMEVRFAVVESVASSPEMGVVSSFTFGEGFGAIQGVLCGLGIQIKFVYPSAWKAGLSLTKNKGESLVLATKLFPEWAAKFKGDKRSHDLSEAALLAYFGATKLAVNVAGNKTLAVER